METTKDILLTDVKLLLLILYLDAIITDTLKKN